MERHVTGQTPTGQIERQLAHLKILSRLLSHELTSQTSQRLTLSREEVGEIQTSIDLFIEEVLGTRPNARPVSHIDTQPVVARVN
jgi:hypothetical protein